MENRILSEAIELNYINSDNMVSYITRIMDKFDYNDQEKISHVLQLFENSNKDLPISIVNNIVGSCRGDLPHYIVSILLCLLFGGNMDLVKTCLEGLQTPIHGICFQSVFLIRQILGQNTNPMLAKAMRKALIPFMEEEPIGSTCEDEEEVRRQAAEVFRIYSTGTPLESALGLDFSQSLKDIPDYLVFVRNQAEMARCTSGVDTEDPVLLMPYIPWRLNKPT